MTYNKEIIVSFAGLLAIAALSSARPNQNEQLVSRSASPFSQVASSKVPAYGRNQLADEVLEFYGGARGQFLVISPSGKMTIRGVSHPPGQTKDEEDVGLASEETDSVAVEQPPASASIAEAKPVAVSVAGIGGTASAQPIATAIVGPGGLALTRPVATAIAGIKGVEGIASVLGGGKKSASGQYNAQYNGKSDGVPPPIYFIIPGQY